MSAELVSTPAGQEAVAAILDDPANALVALDFDGVLSPIVPDPEKAYALPAAVAVMQRLASRIGTLAIITGRPVRTALRLGELDQRAGLEELIILGQYGVERYESGRIIEPEVPEAIGVLRERLTAMIDEWAIEGLYLEDKGRAMAVHTRRTADPAGTLAFCTGPVQAVADELGLHVEPGKNVLEVRAAGRDKGQSLTELVAERGIRSIVYAGDDLGDLPAYAAVKELRGQGIPGVLICSRSTEQNALEEHADVTVAGPPGVAEWLEALADRLASTAR